MPVDRAALLAVSRSFCIPNQLVNLVGELYSGTKCHVRTTEANSEAFEVIRPLPQPTSKMSCIQMTWLSLRNPGVKALDKACERWSVHISVERTKTLAVGEQEPDHLPISIQGQALEEVESFPYLGSDVGQITGVEKEVTVRLMKASTVYIRC